MQCISCFTLFQWNLWCLANDCIFNSYNNLLDSLFLQTKHIKIRNCVRKKWIQSYNNTSKNKTLVEALPMLSFAIANLLVFSFFLLITDEMESKHPWLYLIKDLPIHILWGLTAPLAIYLLNKDTRKHVKQLYLPKFSLR